MNDASLRARRAIAELGLTAEKVGNPREAAVATHARTVFVAHRRQEDPLADEDLASFARGAIHSLRNPTSSFN